MSKNFEHRPNIEELIAYFAKHKPNKEHKK